MNNMSETQGDESAYQEASYYGAIDSSLGDPENEYSTGDMEQRSPLREQDRFLPIANVSKIMKKAIPPQGKVAKDAKECVQECVSEFISFITSEAAERCQNEKRKTINGEDLLWAMSNLGFDNYVDPLKTFLLKYRDAIKIDSSIINSSAEMAVLQHQQQQAAQQAAAAAQHAHPPGTVIVAAPNILNSAALGQRQMTLNGAPAGTTIELQGAAGGEVKQVVVEGGEIKPGTTVTQSSGAPTHLTMANTATGQTFLVPFSGQVAIVNGNAVVTSATT